MRNPDGTINDGQWLHIGKIQVLVYVIASVLTRRLPTDQSDRCIESIRQSITCHSDVSPVLFQWLKSKRINLPHLQLVHRCRNFGKIQDWVFDRFVDLGNRRQRVLDNGRIADYTNLDANPEDDPALLDPPKWWHYNVDDL
ncbi:hypothetical protein B0H66DRAFT_323433 [Apodospora peruviana]|uniref:Uncharacterized protein n=1 Tax=Apodospora peruviana TaxID=516989 RepID=A0AAE0HYG8_9PEZI|nr:hypothetical protein B0H66DRAFT_323433 [Apodospora peruviana]